MNQDTGPGKVSNGFTVMEMTALYREGKVLGFVPAGAITQDGIAQNKSLHIEENVRVLTDGVRGVPLGESAIILMGESDIIREIISSRGK